MNPEVGAMMCRYLHEATQVWSDKTFFLEMHSPTIYVLLMAQGILRRLTRIDERQYASYKSTLTDAARATGVTAVKSHLNKRSAWIDLVAKARLTG